MKKILFIFNIAIALISLNSFSAYGAENGLSRRTLAHDFAVLDTPSPSNDLVFEAYFEDISDDDNDDSNDTKTKKMPSGKTKLTTLFIAHNLGGNYFKNSISTTLHFVLKTPLFIFIRVLRL
jgi:hypothetical protein